MSVENVSPETARGWLSEGAARLIDVREADEFRRTHIDGASNHPLSRLDARQLLATDGLRTIVVCRTGRRSMAAARQLAVAGADQVFNLEGGLAAWQADGGGIVCDRKAPISLQRQVQLIAGTMVLTATILGVLVSPLFLLISGMVGAGLIFAGATDTCGMAVLLARMPWNRPETPTEPSPSIYF